MRKDDEIHGATGTSYDFGARLYDPRVGRWLSIDPAAREYPGISPYVFVENKPIWARDPDGKRLWLVNQAANQAFVGLLSSYGNAQSVAAAMNIRYNTQTGKVSSFDVNPMSERSFARSLRNNGVRLNRADRASLYTTYLATVDAEEIQVEIVQAVQPGMVATPGAPGSQSAGSDSRLNADPGLNQFKADVGASPNGATQAQINQAVRPAGGPGTGPYSPDRVGNGYAKYDSAPELDDTNVGVKETVLIDGTGNTAAQNGQVLQRALATP